MKLESSYSIDIKGVTKEVIGSCLSMGVKVDGKLPKDIFVEISKGNYNDKII
jgi:large subunit ribosomal protein L11